MQGAAGHHQDLFLLFAPLDQCVSGVQDNTGEW